MTQNRFLDVYLRDRYVGTLAETPKGKVAFAYGDRWLEEGFSISPFSLPLRKGVFVPKKEYFGGLWGVFADSFPEEAPMPMGESAILSLADLGTDGLGALAYIHVKKPGFLDTQGEVPEELRMPRPATETELDAMTRDYLFTARECGIPVESDPGQHRVSAAALLELDYRHIEWDYTDFMKLTKIMTMSNMQEVMQMYRRLCFNVFAHVEQDHTKSIAFAYDEGEGRWTLAPATNLGYSVNETGHATSIKGNRLAPGMEEVLAIGREAGLPFRLAGEIADEIRDKTSFLVERWRG